MVMLIWNNTWSCSHLIPASFFPLFSYTTGTWVSWLQAGMAADTGGA